MGITEPLPPINQRVKTLAKALGYNNANEFSRALGMKSSQKMYNFFDGRYKVTTEVLENITTSFEQINCDWLLRGEGNMLHDEKHKQFEQMLLGSEFFGNLAQEAHEPYGNQPSPDFKELLIKENLRLKNKVETLSEELLKIQTQLINMLEGKANR
jgi:DNA-binding LacI/PurR family transcriptional regulator